MTTYEQIQGLRFQLAISIDAGERHHLEAELERAIARHWPGRDGIRCAEQR